MGRILKGIFEVLVMVVLGAVALIVGLLNSDKADKFKKNQKKRVDSFEDDLHDKYAAGEISEMQFGEGLSKIENARKKQNEF